MKKTTHTKQEHTHVKNLKRQLMTKDFLWRLKLHVSNWNEWPHPTTLTTYVHKRSHNIYRPTGYQWRI